MLVLLATVLVVDQVVSSRPVAADSGQEALVSGHGAPGSPDRARPATGANIVVDGGQRYPSARQFEQR